MLNRNIGDRQAELDATTKVGLARILVHEVEAALPPLLAAAEEFADVEDSPAYARLTDIIARAQMRHGRVREAIEWCDRGLPIAERHDERGVALELLITRGTVLGSEGRLIEAVATLRGARIIAAEQGLTQL